MSDRKMEGRKMAVHGGTVHGELPCLQSGVRGCREGDTSVPLWLGVLSEDKGDMSVPTTGGFGVAAKALSRALGP